MTTNTSGLEHPPHVHIYSDGFGPAPNSNGAELAHCSEVQAYLDLGCAVEFVFFHTKTNNLPANSGYFKQLAYTVVDATNETSPRHALLAYRLGWPQDLELWQLYPARSAMLREARARFQKDKSAIHVFHCLRTANVIPSLSKARTIWVCHDIESDFYSRSEAIDRQLEGRQTPYGWQVRMLRRLAELERKLAHSCGLVLCVAPEDAKRMREEWSARNAAYLPISVPYGDSQVGVGQDRIPGELRLLHIGSLHHLPSYTSLQFLLGKVFPLLDPDTIARLKLEVIGAFEPGEPRANAIIEMARPYPMVHFSGFVEDVRTAYHRNDLQVVASTQATGRRTRIIESWAFGMPVLSTHVGVGGVTHLAPGQNILIADDPSDFARMLKELMHNHERLDEIAKAARATYELAFGRQAVANTLRELLQTSFGL